MARFGALKPIIGVVALSATSGIAAW